MPKDRPHPGQYVDIDIGAAPRISHGFVAVEVIEAGSLVAHDPYGPRHVRKASGIAPPIGRARSHAQAGQVVDVELDRTMAMAFEMRATEPSERELIHNHPCVKAAALGRATKHELAAMAFLVSALRHRDLRHINFRLDGIVEVRVGIQSESRETRVVLDRFAHCKTIADLHNLAAGIRERLFKGSPYEIEIEREWQREYIRRRVEDSLEAAYQLAEIEDFVFWFLELAKLDVEADTNRLGENLSEILRR